MGRSERARERSARAMSLTAKGHIQFLCFNLEHLASKQNEMEEAYSRLWKFHRGSFRLPELLFGSVRPMPQLGIRRLNGGAD
jgi:hypothetical protein